MTDTTPARELTVTWDDPLVGAAQIPSMNGIDYLRSMIEGRNPPPPIMRLMGFELLSVEPGEVVFQATPGEQHYNPIGTVHGGLACTLLDSALGCAVQSTLPQGQAYTSIDITISYLRPILATSGTIRCVGTVVKPGSRVAFAEGRIEDSTGKLLATATSSLLVFPVGGGA